MKMKRIQCSHRLGYFWCSVFLVLGIFGAGFFGAGFFGAGYH